MNFLFDRNGLTFVDRDANLGVVKLGLRLQIQENEYIAEYDDSCCCQPEQNILIRAAVAAVPELNAIILTHKISNSGKCPVWIKNLAVGTFAREAALPGGKGSGAGWDLRFCHTDNVRSEHYPHCQMEYPYYRMLPSSTVTLGNGEDQPFPGLFIKDEAGHRGLVFAQASQQLSFINFELCKNPFTAQNIFKRFVINYDFAQTGGFQIESGGEVLLDGIFIQITGDYQPGEAYCDYLSYLTETFKFRGAATPLLNEAFHCTWNYGVFTDQTEKSLMPTAQFIAQSLPNIKWFLIDGGYIDTDCNNNFLDRFYPEPNACLNAERWPRGMRHFADSLRKLGLRPGLWWSPTVRLDSELFHDHPEWFARRADGSVYNIGAQGFLDYTNQGALTFLDKTLAVILGEWGMDACKMDFWSQNFEDRHIRLQNPAITPVQAKKLFFDTVRRHLPADGIFMTCVATGMGNPFTAEWADAYRNTVDIGIGDWHEQVNNCFWALPTLGFEGHKSFLLNADSVGIMPDYPDNENYFRLSWCHITMGMLETGGKMEIWPEKWVNAMRKLTDRADRGYMVRCPDIKAFTGIPLPDVLYVNYPQQSKTWKAGIRQCFALFNWSDDCKIIVVKHSDLGHIGNVTAENFWTGDIENFNKDFIIKELQPRSALLYDVKQ